MRINWAEQINSIYGSIMDGFIDNVCDPHKNKEAFHEFREQLEVSKQFAYKHPVFAILQELLNRFACDWDDVIEQNRKTKNPLHMLSPYHRFLLIPNHRQELGNPVIQAFMFVKKDLPDSRTVVIKFDSLKQDTLRCIMHEMGHFVGFRDRQKRLFEFFIPVLADSICRNVYECACSYATFDELNLSNWSMVNYSEDESYSKRTNKFAYYAINCLREIYPTLVSDMKLEYQKTQDIYTNASINDKITDQETHSIYSGFFCSIEAVMLTAISNLLHSDEFSAKLFKIVSEYNIQHCQEFENELPERLLEGFSYIRSTLSKYDEKPSWYMECENILEEPAADMFMIKMSNLKVRRYVDLMVNQIQKIPTVNSLDDMQNFLSQRSVNVRIVGIMHAMGMKTSLMRKVFYVISMRILPRSSHLFQRIVIKQQLDNMLKKANELTKEPMYNDFFDPTRYAFKYIQSLWEDKRYTDFVRLHGKQIRLLEYTWQFVRLLSFGKHGNFLPNSEKENNPS